MRSSGDLLPGCHSSPSCHSAHLSPYSILAQCQPCQQFIRSTGAAPSSSQLSHINTRMYRVGDERRVCAYSYKSLHFIGALKGCESRLTAFDALFTPNNPASLRMSRERGKQNAFVAQITRCKLCEREGRNATSECTRLVLWNRRPCGSVISQADGSVLKASK